MFPEVGDAGVSLPGAGAAESARSPGGARGARPGGLGIWAPAPRWPRARGRGRKGGPAFGRTDAAPGSARSRAPRVSRPRRPSLGPSPGRPRWRGKHLLSISRCADAALPGPPVCLWGARASPRTRRAQRQVRTWGGTGPRLRPPSPPESLSPLHPGASHAGKGASPLPGGSRPARTFGCLLRCPRGSQGVRQGPAPARGARLPPPASQTTAVAPYLGTCPPANLPL